MDFQSYGEFSSAIHQRLVNQRIPVEGTVEVTWRCSQKCLHCYNNLSMDDSRARQEELSYEEHCRILDEITEAGCLWLLYTGGEIFARKDFIDIYAYAKNKGLLITLFTNGTLITSEIADYLTESVPFSIEISLYGATRETHERLTGTPGSFEKCIRGIRLLRERSLPLKIKTAVTRINKHELWEMKRFAEEELGLEFRFDCILNPRLDCSGGPLSVRLQPWEAVNLDLHDPMRVVEWKKFACEFNGPLGAPNGAADLYRCGGGINSFAIGPTGKLSICILDPGEAYDLRQGSFRDGWENHLSRVRRQKTTHASKCTSCEIQDMCGMCPANGRLECQDPESPVDFLCHVAHLRSYALDMPVPSHGKCAYCEGGSNYEGVGRVAANLKKGVINVDSALARSIR